MKSIQVKLFGVIVTIVLMVLAVVLCLMTMDFLLSLGPVALIAIGLGGAVWWLSGYSTEE